jgi:hypothetical protein
MNDGEGKLIDVIGVSEEDDLISDEAPASLSYRERLFVADGDDPVEPQVGTVVGTCRQTPGGQAVCMIVLNLNGEGGFPEGQVIAVGDLPFDGGLKSGKLTIVRGSGGHANIGGTLHVKIWNPKKYSQTVP